MGRTVLLPAATSVEGRMDFNTRTSDACRPALCLERSNFRDAAPAPPAEGADARVAPDDHLQERGATPRPGCPDKL